MKIVYFSSSIIPSRTANSIQVMKMCQAFSELGHEVRLFAPDRAGKEEDFDAKNIFEFYGVKRNFEIKQFPWFSIKGKGFIYGLMAALEAHRLGVDLAYGRDFWSCFFAVFFRMPTIYEAHRPISHQSKLKKWVFSTLINLDKLDRLVVISKALKDHFLNTYNLKPAQIIVAHDAADKPSNRYVSNSNFENHSFHAGYIGHLYKGKGMNVIAELVKECPWAKFHIIGGTRQKIAGWKKKLRAYDNIKFHGFVPNQKTEQYRQSCDVLLAPYQRHVTGYGGGKNASQWMSPLKLFEYMASEKPIISSNLPVLKEVLTDRENALLCPPDNIEAWKNAMKEIKENESLRKELSSKARKDFEEKHTWKARAKKILNQNILEY